MRYWSKVLDIVDEDFLIVAEADDLATLNSQLGSIELYQEMIGPYHTRLFNHIKKEAKGKIYIFSHRCGVATPFSPCLIEEGVNILIPVQFNGYCPSGVLPRFDRLAPGGGFIFSTIPNIQAAVPPENIIAVWETLQEYGIY
jgi:uroporphyrinogen decarboxylase